MKESAVFFSSTPGETLKAVLEELRFSKAFLVSDRNAYGNASQWFPILESFPKIIVGEGEINKSLNTLGAVWEAMLRNGVHRSDILVNLGGGVVCDLGGFAAATYMRGIGYINIPTTLLAAVDASSGGKTAIDFCGVKNLVGAFHSPLATIVSPQPLRTLSREDMLSGWGEMLKHALLDSEAHLRELLSADVLNLSDERLLRLIKKSAEVKRKITEADPLEKGMRRMLNLGHTAGHAIEALMLGKGVPVSHGHAVALGVLAELSCGGKFPPELFGKLSVHIHNLFRPVVIGREDCAKLETLLLADKKNSTADSGRIAYVSMDAPGHADICAETSSDELIDAIIRNSVFVE